MPNPKIGFNPQDRFMLALGNTLVVVTTDGSVFGADVVDGQVQPVFQFAGAKIGFNPQDRFMLALGNTLVVVTTDGSVFGADVVNRKIQPVFQFAGAKIGFNPQDRFMLALGNTLVVVTTDGSVFSADVVGSGAGRFLAPVQRFDGARIGFNPQDRFMTAVADALVVVTADGSVYGAHVKSTFTGRYIGINHDGSPMGQIMHRELEPIFQYTGPKIGFNPDDRFMLALGQKLTVVTHGGDVYGTDVSGHRLLALYQLNDPMPTRLQFRLRYFIEHDSTDDFLQGANDEVYLSALGTDSAAVVVGEGGKPVATTITTQPIGDVSADPIRNAWRDQPYVLMEFDLPRESDWPRSFVATLLIVEEDNGNLAEAFRQLETEVGETVKKAAEAAATTAAGALVGAAIGTAIPFIGTAVGAAVGSLAGLAYDEIIKEIMQGLDNDVFTPRPIQLLIGEPAHLRHHSGIGTPQHIDIQEHDGHYTLEYDWALVG